MREGSALEWERSECLSPTMNECHHHQPLMHQMRAQVLARLTHPNVVRLIAACMTPPRFCLVMVGRLLFLLFYGANCILLLVLQIDSTACFATLKKKRRS